MGEYLLGIDNGLTLSKAALVRSRGREVKVASRKIEVQYPKPGYTDRNMDTVWQTTAEAIREVIETSGINPSEILAIGNSGHGNGLYMLDRDDKVFRPSIASMDGRAGDLVAEWLQPGGVHDQAFPYTLQGCWAAQPSVLLAWLKRHEPESYHRIGKVMLCTDFLKFCLTGEHTTDFSIISGSSLLESAKQAYSRELLEIYGIPEMFPGAAAAGLGTRDRGPRDARSGPPDGAGRRHTGRRRPVRHRRGRVRFRGDQRRRAQYRRGHVEHQPGHHGRTDHRQTGLPVFALYSAGHVVDPRSQRNLGDESGMVCHQLLRRGKGGGEGTGHLGVRSVQ